MVDLVDSKSTASRRTGSSPVTGTTYKYIQTNIPFSKYKNDIINKKLNKLKILLPEKTDEQLLALLEVF